MQKRLLSFILTILFNISIFNFAFAQPVSPVQEFKPEFILTNAASREAIDLSGDWIYSKDLYQTGLTDINGKVAKSRMQRYRDINVEQESLKNPYAFYEFDMQRGPKMSIPNSWNSVVPELRYYDGLIWFQKTFNINKENQENKRVFAHFEAVNYKAHVYLNGVKIGEHIGGFTPFSIEMTDKIRNGENSLTIGVDSSHNSPESIPSNITDWDIYGGITRKVRIIFTPNTFINDAYLMLDKNKNISGEIALNGKLASNQAINIEIEGVKTKIIAKTDENGLAKFEVKAPKNLKLWSPENPNLYKVKFKTNEDELNEKIGFRTIRTEGKKILLNDKPIFLSGISMHEEEIGENPSRLMTEEAIRKLYSEVKNGLNGNYIRLSHYPHSELAVRIADEMGILIWSEIPIYWTIDYNNPKVLVNAKKMFAENIYRDRNRASVIIWSIANETPIDDDRNRFLSDIAKTVRQFDNSRLISAALLTERKIIDNRINIYTDDPLVKDLDIMAVNTYNGWYGDDKLEDVGKAIWHTPNDKPLIVSEFGADAQFGVHAKDVPYKFSEEFQAEYYRQTLKMIDNMENVSGISPWILKDFRSPRREHPIYQNGWNRKGLIDELGRRKLAFEVLANYYKSKQ